MCKNILTEKNTHIWNEVKINFHVTLSFWGIYQTLSSWYSGVVGRCIHDSYREYLLLNLGCLSALPELITAPDRLLHMRPGFIQHKLQRKVVQFVGFFFFKCVGSFRVFCLFCISASSDFMEKKKKWNAQRWCCCNDLCKLLFIFPFHCCCWLIN